MRNIKNIPTEIYLQIGAGVGGDFAALPLCDAIYLLDGWETSKGAKLEFDVASTCGLKIYYQSNKLIQ